jgi:hypothetical protein
MAAAWLLLVHQLPPSRTSVRVKTWRRLQDIGAVSVKNSVWVLPASAQAREDFEWIKREIEAAKGGAIVFAADSIDTFSNDEVVAAFRDARDGDYRALAGAAAKLTARLQGSARTRTFAMRQVRQIEDRLARIDAIAFFPQPAREKAAAAVAALQAAAKPKTAAGRHASSQRLAPARYQGRTWVTRPRPGIDRMSSAWLIRRFIDPKARFTFAEKPPQGESAVPFDMFGVEFGHAGAGCTFETLTTRFGVEETAVEAIAEIVHDLDLKETRFGRPEAAAMGRLVEGLRATFADDQELLAHGIVMFEALYRSFQLRAGGGYGGHGGNGEKQPQRSGGAEGARQRPTRARRGRRAP